MKYILIYPKRGKKGQNGQKYLWSKTAIIHHILTCIKTYEKVSQYSGKFKKSLGTLFCIFSPNESPSKTMGNVFYSI